MTRKQAALKPKYNPKMRHYDLNQPVLQTSNCNTKSEIAPFRYFFHFLHTLTLKHNIYDDI